MAVTGPSTVSRIALAFPAPVANSKMDRAFMMVPIPMVMAIVGTASNELKYRALSIRVFLVNVFTRVLEASEEPISLNPI